MSRLFSASFTMLRSAHRAGAALGWLLLTLNPRMRQLALDNMLQSGLFTEKSGVTKKALRDNFAHFGKAIAETPLIWRSDAAQIAALVRQVHGWELVENTQKVGKGIIFLTPHMGCFEVTSRYYALHAPITVLYRPPKQAWLTNWVNQGRQHANVALAPANMHGVKALMQALKRGEAIGILPDQIPQAGEGEWADFFGKPAYTMTLASKLATKTGATIMMAFGERLADGKGYEIHLNQIDSIATPDLLNQAVEAKIANNPSQYLWQYNRHKVSRKAKPQTSNLA